MALTDHQRAVCRVIAAHRIELGESYVAGGVALNELLGASRISRDVDLFHDSESAVHAAWNGDRDQLEREGFTVYALRETPAFVEAEVRRDGSSVLVQWARDSAYRFFPLVEHDDLGLVLHPVDLATNKVLALVGRLEVRDWIDVLECDRTLQPLGYLAWAACAKDPGFSPTSILEHAARSARYSRVEVAELAFAGPPPDAGELSRRWHGALEEGRRVVQALPADEVGKCVVTRSGELYRGHADTLGSALHAGSILFHEGSLRGAWPRVG